MKTLVAVSVLVLVGICCAEAQAQQSAQPGAQQNPPPASTPAPGSSSSSSSSSAPTPKGERRFTGGATLSVMGLSLLTGATSTIYTSTELNTEFQTTGASERIGYGLTFQARVTDHYYVDLSALFRRIGYQLNTTVTTTTTSTLNGVSFPSTSTTSTHEDTRADLIDVPVLVRYYGTGKRPNSPRWFLEAGPTGRFAEAFRTSIAATDSSGVITSYTFTPTLPKNDRAIGMTVGAGIQFTDEFGIHVVPEFRYTRWVNPIYENLTTNTEKNEIEADISLTF